MERIFNIALPIALLAVVVTLFFGLYALFRGGDFGRSYSNKLMRLRVVLQFVAVCILVAAFYWRSRGGLMVTLNKIYTRTGDAGSTRLATGEPVSKDSARVEAYGAVDETNACVGLVRLHTQRHAVLDGMLSRIQNELFDLGADLATPERGKDLGWEPLRITEGQVERIEREIDQLNAELSPLESFVLPAGSAESTYLHLARTVCRRAERQVVTLKAMKDEIVSDAALKYLNRLSDFLFVAARWANGKGADEVLWQPGATR